MFRFGNFRMTDLADIRSKLLFHASSIKFYLNMCTMGSVGRLEQQMKSARGVLKEIQLALHNMVKSSDIRSNPENSVLTTYSSDDKAVWKDLRRELIMERFSSSDIQKHK